jgi:streptomycin 6-kinase
MTPEYYLKVWGLSDPQLLATTPTSQVYTVNMEGTRVVLKLLTPIGVADEKGGAVALRCFKGRGAVRLLREDGKAHLLEYANGESLVPMVKSGEDEQAAAIIAGVLNQLHQADQAQDGLIPLKARFRSLFSRAKAEPDSIYARAALFAEDLLDHQREVCVLHGDIHHDNIRHHRERGWLAFDPKGLYGERIYDTANIFCNPPHMQVENEARILKIAAILADKLNSDVLRILSFAYIYACLSASWWLESDGDPSDALRVAEIIEPHL